MYSGIRHLVFPAIWMMFGMTIERACIHAAKSCWERGLDLTVRESAFGESWKTQRNDKLVASTCAWR